MAQPSFYSTSKQLFQYFAHLAALKILRAPFFQVIAPHKIAAYTIVFFGIRSAKFNRL